MATLTSTLVLNLRDNVSANAANVVRALGALQDATKQQAAGYKRDLADIRDAQRKLNTANHTRIEPPRASAADVRQFRDAGARARRSWNEGFEGAGGDQGAAGRMLGGVISGGVMRNQGRKLFESAGSGNNEGAGRMDQGPAPPRWRA